MNDVDYYNGMRLASVETELASALEPEFDLGYRPRDYASLTRSNWDDCLYCPGGGRCHYNHVETGANGDARARKPQLPFETVVDRPLVGSVPLASQHQRFTTYEMQRSVLR